MAAKNDETSSPKTAESATTDRGLMVAAAEPGEAETAPVIVARKKKRKKKRKRRYTAGTQDLQRLSLGFAKASYRLSNAVTMGLDRFHQESRKSGSRKRDGAARDVLVNASLGMSDAAREVGKVPFEVAKQLNTKLLWRQARFAARLLIPPGLMR